MRMLGKRITGFLVLILVSLAATASARVGVFTWHNDNARTGQNLTESRLTPATVRSQTFGKLFTLPVDGQVYAQPLFVADLSIPGQGRHDVVYVATEHDSVYAFDADGRPRIPLWRASLASRAGVTPLPSKDTGDTYLVTPEMGITGTPVIDPVTGTLYALAATKEIHGASVRYLQELHALDIATGAEKFGGPVSIEAIVPGSGVGNDGHGHVPFDPLREFDREALVLSRGVVYIAFASHADFGAYHGWVLGYDAATLKQVMVFNATPNGEQGGIWQSGAGPAADDSGDLFFVTGNGTFDADSGGPDYGDSIVRLAPTGKVVDYFTPYNQAGLSEGDVDVGSTAAILLPDQPGAHTHLAMTATKHSDIYLVDRDHLGGYNPRSNDQIVQFLPGALHSRLGAFASPVFFKNRVYIGAEGDVIRVFELKEGRFRRPPVMQTTNSFAYPGASMSISAHGSQDGILWVVERPAAKAAAVLHAYLADDLAQELYNSREASERDRLPPAIKFAPPTIAGGKVYVVGPGGVTVFGLIDRSRI